MICPSYWRLLKIEKNAETNNSSFYLQINIKQRQLYTTKKLNKSISNAL